MPESLFPLISGERRTDGTSEHVARIGWLLLRLLHDRTVEYAAYRDRFGRSKRGFQRDLRQLREIGSGHFTISPTKSGRVLLTPQNSRLSELHTQNCDARATLARIAAALGGPLASEMRSAVGETSGNTVTGFLHVREPLPSAGDRITKIFEFLKTAAAGPARVEFLYVSRGARSTRRVEPYHVIERSGRYYLIAYDLGRKDWRHFALDAIEERTLRKEGTFTPRTVPERLLAERAVGWIRAHGETDVTIRVSPIVADAVKARRWQKEQRITALPEGGLEITLTVDDIGEAVRWALQFGPEAVIIAPPQAVTLARETAAQIAEAYEKPRRTGVARAV